MHDRPTLPDLTPRRPDPTPLVLKVAWIKVDTENAIVDIDQAGTLLVLTAIANDGSKRIVETLDLRPAIEAWVSNVIESMEQ